MRGCPEHGDQDFRLYKYKSGRIERRCLVCARERSGYGRRNHGPRCRKGHLKTAFTWRFYGTAHRCMVCHAEARARWLEKQKVA